MWRGMSAGVTVPLGKMTVGERLGEGGFGIVHKATLEGVNLTFAVKFLDPSVFNDAEKAAVRFLREAEILFRLRHPNIVPIYGIGEYEGRPYILMEHFRGMNLIDARHVGQPTPEVVLPFIEYIGGALAYAHRNNVVHRDIRPQNLMTTKGDARVLDFGIAGLLDPRGERFTKSNDAVGGDAFSAPELTEQPMLLDPRCDIYSLGACWFWLLTGTSPKGLNWESRLRASAAASQPYERVLLRCLDQPERRYPSAEALVEDVRALRSGGATSQAPHDLSDDQARVLGAIVTACPTSLNSVAFYGIEQEIGNRQVRLRTSLALRSLLQRGMVVEGHEQGYNDNEPYAVYRPTDTGVEWAGRNVARVEDLLTPLGRMQEVEAEVSAEIPFLRFQATSTSSRL